MLSGADVRRLLEFEGEKQALGYEADTSCLAEIAGAMGARLVVFGEAGKLGSRYLLNPNRYNSEKAKASGRAALLATSLDGLVEASQPPEVLRSMKTPLVGPVLVLLDDKHGPSSARRASEQLTSPRAQR